MSETLTDFRNYSNVLQHQKFWTITTELSEWRFYKLLKVLINAYTNCYLESSTIIVNFFQKNVDQMVNFIILKVDQKKMTIYVLSNKHKK